MALYCYVKKKESVPLLTVRFLSYIMITVGFGFLVWAVYPILLFEAQTQLTTMFAVTSPVYGVDKNSKLASSQVLGASNALSQNVRSFLQIKDWFPEKPQNKLSNSLTQKEYWISIPKLGIDKAKVEVGGEDLSKNLIHYLPSTAPGEYGSVNIFGHSTLPQLFNVKDYKTIFTYLPSLTKGDRIFVDYDSQKFEYEVYDMFVVKPEQISVLEPQYDASYMTLITCVPPGTYWNRLVVRTKLRHLPFEDKNKAG
ncbi:MAG: sortase [Patescibacteria group bacterium]